MTHSEIVAAGTMSLARHTTTPQCPKCMSQEVQVSWHSTPVLKLDDPYPCSSQSVEETPEHLCIRCWRCGYRWSTKVADDAEEPQ